MTTIGQASSHHALDPLDKLAGLPADSPVQRLRLQREAVRSATQASRQALFDQVGPAPGLGLADRALAAFRVARLADDAALADHYQGVALQADAPEALLAWLGQAALTPAQATRAGPPAGLAAAAVPASLAAWSAWVPFVDRLAREPAAAGPGQLQPLLDSGIGLPAVVTLAQVVAFVSYELRVAAGLRALAAAAPQADPAVPGGETASASPDAASHRPEPSADWQRGDHALPAATLRHGAFTLDELAWRAWLPTVDAARADADQLAVLDESNPQARSSPYYLVLLHNPTVLRQRSRLFNAIMYSPGGLPRAERELATVAVSRINGCPYCASVHARLFVQLAKQPRVIEAIYAQGTNTPLPPRWRALVDLSVDLCAPQPLVPAGRIAQLRAAGLSDLETLDAVHAAAIFAWANRLMQTLGEPVPPG